MTVIAYRSGYMAGDRICTFGDDYKIELTRPKIAKDSNGVLYGVAGPMSRCSELIEAVQKQAATGGSVVLPIPQKGEEFQVLIAYPDGRLRLLDENGEVILDDQKYAAIGSGMGVALGAMFAGAGAIVAVEATIAHHRAAAGPVDMLFCAEPLGDDLPF